MLWIQEAKGCPRGSKLAIWEHFELVWDLFLSYFDEVLRYGLAIKFIKFHHEISIYVNELYLYYREAAAQLGRNSDP